MKTPKSVILPDPEQITDMVSLREFCRQLVRILEEILNYIYQDIKELQP